LTNGDYFGDIQLNGGTIPLSLPYWVRVDPPGNAGLGGRPPQKV
jgi:hypothetical protein